MKLITNGINKLCAVCFSLASWLCLFLVLLTVQQVFARYLFHRSSIALQELEWYLFGFIFLLSSAYALGEDDHVRVDIIYSHLPKKGQTLVDILGLALLVIPVTIVLIYYSSAFVISATSYTNSRPDDYYLRELFSVDSLIYQILLPVEAFIRNTILIGEISADPGGLEGRWIIKAAIPFGCLLLLLRGISLLIDKFTLLYSLVQRTHGKDSSDGS